MFIIIKGEKFYRPGVNEDMKEKIKFIREEFNKIKFCKRKKRDKNIPHFT